MRVIEITKPGEADVLRSGTREIPTPAAGQVLIRVAAAGINRPDILQRKGFYPPPAGASDLPGLEVAGTIEALGPGAVGEKGARVMALIPGGGYAEYALAHYRHILPIPQGLSFEKAAALPETLYTVWANVFDHGGIRAGQTLFVHGATSGIGTMAISLANAFDIKIYGTAGTAKKCATAERLGFQKCFNYKEDDWQKEIIALGGVDVLLDMVGGSYLAKNIQCLKPNGRHASIAFLGGPEGSIPILPVMQKQLTLTGSTLRARDDDEKARLTDDLRTHVLPRIAIGEIAPVMDKTFVLEDAAAAHRRMEAGEHIGKIVLMI